METKICNTCGEEKPLTEFNFRDKRKGTYRAQCKECLHKRKNELYQTRYKERYREQLKENKNKHRELIRQKIKELKSCGCMICGETEPCCLDFHHLYDKEYTISSNADVALDTLLAEVEKCIVLCANCHRKLHAGKITLPAVDPTEATNNIYKYKQMTIKFKKLSDKATQPVRTTDSGAGYNLTATHVSTEVNERGQLIVIYHTDLAVEIPDGFEGVLRPHKSITAKTIRMIDCPSVISGNMDDEIVAKFIVTTDVIPSVYKEGDNIAQLVINKIEDTEFVEFIDTTEKEQSAAEGSQSLPENEDESNNSETATEASGEAQSGLEQA